MNLQQFMKKYPNLAYTETKKLIYNKYPIKLKVRFNGCYFFRFKERNLPTWIKTDTKITTVRLTHPNVKIQVDPVEFRLMHKVIGEKLHNEIRIDAPHYVNAHHIMFYFDSLKSTDKFLSRFPFMEKIVNISVAGENLTAGEIVVSDSLIKQGFKYKVSLRPFTINKEDVSKYTSILDSNDVFMPGELHKAVLNKWPNELRNSWRMYNKSIYVKDLQIATMLGLAFGNIVQSINTLTASEKKTWQK